MSFANLDDINLMNKCAILLHQSIADLTYPLQLNWFIDWYNLDMSIFLVLVVSFNSSHSIHSPDVDSILKSSYI
jgi:hypothetical protein